jgi:hypothetical protein
MKFTVKRKLFANPNSRGNNSGGNNNNSKGNNNNNSKGNNPGGNNNNPGGNNNNPGGNNNNPGGNNNNPGGNNNSNSRGNNNSNPRGNNSGGGSGAKFNSGNFGGKENTPPKDKETRLLWGEISKYYNKLKKPVLVGTGIIGATTLGAGGIYALNKYLKNRKLQKSNDKIREKFVEDENKKGKSKR